jgi:hypothetical protein
MTPQQAKNLSVLIRHMETKVTRMLNMLSVFDEWPEPEMGVCGTPACAMGEAYFVKALRPQFKERPDCINFPSLAIVLFGVSYRLFGANDPQDGTPSNAWNRDEVTPLEWAAEARKVLTENGYSMDDGFPAFMEKTLKPLDFKQATRELQHRYFDIPMF